MKGIQQISINGSSLLLAEAAKVVMEGFKSIDKTLIKSGVLLVEEDTAESRLARTAVDFAENLVTSLALSIISNQTENIYDKVGLSQENLEFALKILNAANLSFEMALSIYSIGSSSTVLVPLPLAAMTKLTTSIKQRLNATFMKLYYKSLTIATSYASLIGSGPELLSQAIIKLLDKAYDEIDKQVYKLTGYTLTELIYMLDPLIKLYKAYKEKRKQELEEGKEEEEKGEKKKKEDKEEYPEKDKQVKEAEKKQRREQMKKTASAIAGVVAVDILEKSSQEIYLYLMKQLSKLDDIFYNAFIILTIRDAFFEIQEFAQKYHHQSLSDMEWKIQDFFILYEMLVLMGVKGSEVLTKSNKALIALETLTEMANLKIYESALYALTGEKPQVKEFAKEEDKIDPSKKVTILESKKNVIPATKTVKVKETKNAVKQAEKRDYVFLPGKEPNLLIITMLSNPSKISVHNSIRKLLKAQKDPNDDTKSMFNNTTIETIINNIQNIWYNYMYNKGGENTFAVKTQTSPLLVFEFTVKCANTLPDEPVKVDYRDSLTLLVVNDKYMKQTDSTEQILLELTSDLIEVYTSDPNAIKEKRPALQIVKDLFEIIEAIFPLLNTYKYFMRNYKINKEYLFGHANDNMSQLIEDNAHNMGLDGEVLGDKYNSFIVDREDVLKFLKDTFLMVILERKRTYLLYKDLTLRLIEFLDLKSIAHSLDGEKMTKVILNLDNNLETSYDGNKNILYYNDTNLPTQTSLILRAISKNEDPF